jgi:hypothetical protein
LPSTWDPCFDFWNIFAKNWALNWDFLLKLLLVLRTNLSHQWFLRKMPIFSAENW